MNHCVYLAGPIAGLNYSGATEWRDIASAELAAAGIKALSPLRGFDHLKNVESFCPRAEDHDRNATSGSRAVMTRDRFDATRCDLLLVNLLGAGRVSIGTVMEIAWADLKRTPIVCIMEPGNVHEHAMVSEAIGWRAHSLEEALSLVKAVLQ